MGQAQTKNEKKNVQNLGSKERYFIQNGALLMEKHMALTQGKDIGAGQLKIISEQEIKKATNNYDPDLIIFTFGDYAFVYKGSLHDRNVTIGTLQDRFSTNPELVDRLMTEVSVAMAMYNCNTPKLYGCCLETYTSMPVYDISPHKSLHHYLHGEASLNNPMKWSDRLKVVTDMAYTLSYMHTAFSKPLVHRDVMSINFLIDDSFHAKLGNFGYAVCINLRNKEQRWPVKGTPGYIDPEYIETQQVTDKCDVYSFGVLLLELLTRKDPAAMAKSGIDLVQVFVSNLERNCMDEIIDSVVLKHECMDKLQRFIRLALTCVVRRGEDRPAMVDVAGELRLIHNVIKPLLDR